VAKAIAQSIERAEVIPHLLQGDEIESVNDFGHVGQALR
jgi:hypothetical protein